MATIEHIVCHDDNEGLRENLKNVLISFFANGFVLQAFYTLPSPKAAVRSAAEVNLVSVNFRIVHKK